MNFKVEKKNLIAFLAVTAVLLSVAIWPQLWLVVLPVAAIVGIVMVVKKKNNNRLVSDSDSVETIEKTEVEPEPIQEMVQEPESKPAPEAKQPRKSNKNKFLFGGAVISMILGSFVGGFLLAGSFIQPIETVIEKTVIKTVEVPVPAPPPAPVPELVASTSTAFAEEVSYDSYGYESYGQGGGRESSPVPTAPITPVVPAIEVIETPSEPIELVPDETIPVEPEIPVTPAVKPVVKILFDGFPIIYIGETFNVFATVLAEKFNFVQSDVIVQDESVLSATAEEAEGGIDISITGLEAGETTVQLPEGMAVDNGEGSDSSNVLRIKVIAAPEEVVDEPVVEEPPVEEPVVEEPTVEEPVVEEPTVEEPVVEEPTVEEPVVIETPSEPIQLPEVPSSDQSPDEPVFE